MPAANSTNRIAQPINSGFRELVRGGGGAASGVSATGAGGSGGWACAGVTEVCSLWPQLPQNGPETGAPQLLQKLGMGRFYKSELRVTTAILYRKIALRPGMEIALYLGEGGQL